MINNGVIDCGHDSLLCLLLTHVTSVLHSVIIEIGAARSLLDGFKEKCPVKEK